MISTSLDYAEEQIHAPAADSVFEWMDFEPIDMNLRLPVRNMIDNMDFHAENHELNIHTEVYNNFHPIVVSQGRVRNRPLIAWPVTRVEMNNLSHLTSKTSSKTVTVSKVDQSSGSWFLTVDRVVVVDVLTDNTPTVMTVLENPFSTIFRDLGGMNFMDARHELLKKLFAWPSEEVSFHNSLVSFGLERMKEIAKWLEILGEFIRFKKFFPCMKI